MAKFTKTPYTIEQSLELLRARGLSITNHKEASHALTYIGYYRLLGYGRFYYQEQRESNPRFVPGTDFSDVLALYAFDRELRLLLLDAIERIEVAVRTVISNYMSVTYSNPHWLLDKGLMLAKIELRNKNKYKKQRPKVTTYTQLIKRILNDTQYHQQGGNNPIYRHYYANYSEGPELPASWMLTEGLSMGTWTFIYSFIKSNKDKKTIARYFRLNAELFYSWLLSLTFLRNLAAHHALVCYRHYHISPESPRRINDEFKQDFDYGYQKLYPFVLAIEYILKTIVSTSNWDERLKALLLKFNKINLAALGFPQDWHNSWSQQDFWQSQIKVT